jgi:hypothetical protein
VEERFMWVPPSWLIHSALGGAAHAAARSARATASVPGKATKVARCEACGRSYAHELKRIGHGQADGQTESSYSLARQRAEADLRHLLEIGIEVIPCPACGWYQSNMIPKARRRHRRWIAYVGQCLTIGLIPVAIIGGIINGSHEKQVNTPLPWPIFVAGLVCLFAVGIGMFIWKYKLAQTYDPNDEDVEARKRYGQSRAMLLPQ